MNPAVETQIPALETTGPAVIQIMGVGTAGVRLLDTLAGADFAGAARVAIDTDAASLTASGVSHKIQLDNRLVRGLDTGGDAEHNRALAEAQYATLKAAGAGAQVILLVAGLGGGVGGVITPLLARAARETGALVLAFVTLPFDWEGSHRRDQARQDLKQIRAQADGVICLPNQKTFKLIDENTGVAEFFRISAGLLTEALRGVWQLMTRPGLIQIHLADLCALLRDKNSEAVFAFVEAAGSARAREVVEKLLAHPLLDEGRALAESDTVLVNLMGGRDLTMGEVNRVMEQITRQCEHARVIMGAALDEPLKDRLTVTVIAARHGRSAAPGEAAPSRGAHACPPPREPSGKPHAAGGRRKADPKLRQEMLPLATISKGRFDKSEPTIHHGEDLDIPTYLRRGVSFY